MYSNLDLTGLFWLAMIGIGAVVLATIGGGGALIWFFIFHVRIV
jgi:hypothetical protein